MASMPHAVKPHYPVASHNAGVPPDNRQCCGVCVFQILSVSQISAGFICIWLFPILRVWHYLQKLCSGHSFSLHIARSRDGISNWERHPENPIIQTEENQWDHDACYKPFVIFDNGRWLLWYNGRRGGLEQIGLAIHNGEDLGF